MAKFARFLTEDGSPTWGAVDEIDSDGTVSGRLLRRLPAERDSGYYPALLSAFDSGGEDTAFSAEASQVLSPIGRPAMILAIGLNYQDHFDEANEARIAAGQASLTQPIEPTLFVKSPATVIGTEDSIVLPHMAPSKVDFEVELAVVIGREALNVPVATAMRYVAYCTVGHDVSARDVQLDGPSGQWVRGKSFDTFCPLGPFAVTGIETSSLDVGLRLNGESMQSSNTTHLIFDVPNLVSYLSHSTSLLPGTVIMTGTPGGVGHFMDPPLYLKPGDVTEAEIEHIGTLRNTVIADGYRGDVPPTQFSG